MDVLVPILREVSCSSASPGASYGRNAASRSVWNFGHPAKLSPRGVLASVKYCPFQEAASPSFMKDRVYAIFFLSSLYISSFSSRYKVTSCINLSNSFRFPENCFGGFIFSSVGLAAGIVKVGAKVRSSVGPPAVDANGFDGSKGILWSDVDGTGPKGPPNTVAIMSTSVSVFGFVCLISSSKSRSVGSVNTGAVVKLSWVFIVSGVCRSLVVGALHNSSRSNGSKLENTGVRPPGSSIVLLVREAGSSSSSGDGLSSSRNPKNPFLLEDVLVRIYLAS